MLNVHDTGRSTQRIVDRVWGAVSVASVYSSYFVGTVPIVVQGDSFGTRPKKMRISQRLFIRF